MNFEMMLLKGSEENMLIEVQDDFHHFTIKDNHAISQISRNEVKSHAGLLFLEL